MVNESSRPTEEELVERRKHWPEVFKVCKEHKAAFFEDYENARTDLEGPCEICNPPENDALGG